MEISICFVRCEGVAPKTLTRFGSSPPWRPPPSLHGLFLVTKPSLAFARVNLGAGVPLAPRRMIDFAVGADVAFDGAAVGGLFAGGGPFGGAEGPSGFGWAAPDAAFG